ncbi:MAG: SPFH domain-containing protein [Halopseudomonas sp.]
MGIINGLKRQLRSVIQWDNDHNDMLFYQWTDNGDEIKNASKIVVGPGQGCIFVYRGKVKAMLHKEGVYPLQTANIPFITTLSKFMQFFESEHKVGIYFFKKAKVLDQKWGTSSAIKYQDPKYDFPVGLKAYGNYSYQLANPRSFFVNVVGGRESFSIADLRQVMSKRIIHPLSDYLAESQFSYAEIDANREEVAQGMATTLQQDFDKLGFRITDFRIEGTDFDEDTLARVNRIADVTADAFAAKKAGVDFAELQRLEALRDAAANENGAAGAGVGIGAGIGMGQQMAQSMSQPAAADAGDDIIGKLAKLKTLFENQLITEQEYTAKKSELLDKL